MRRFSIIPALAAALLAAEPAYALQEDDYAALNRRAIEQHAEPRYAVLVTATTALAASAKTFCASPDDEKLLGLRRDYHAGVDAWQGIQHIRFGPVELFFRSQRIAFWPDQRNTIGKQMAEILAQRNPGLLEPQKFGRGSVAVQGLPAMERLLFGADAPKLPAPGEDARYRCDYLVAIAANLSGMAQEVRDEWQEQPINGKDTSLDLFKSLYTAIELVADHKLARPLGASAAEARPRLAESWRSTRSLDNIRHNLEAARHLYATAFAPVIADQALDAEITRAFERTIAAARAVKIPLEDAVQDRSGRPALETLGAEIIALKGLLMQRLPAALDLPLGFNALDGD